MSLLEKVQAHYASGESSPPHYVDGFELVAEEHLGNLRWGQQVKWVFKEGDEHVAVVDVEPATEMQDWGDYGEPQIFLVKPVEVTVIKYEAVK